MRRILPSAGDGIVPISATFPRGTNTALAVTASFR